MKSFISIPLLFIALSFSGCNSKKENPFLDQEIIELHFENYSKDYFIFQRIPNYEFDTLESGWKMILRHKNRILSNTRPIINIALVIDWKYNQSHVLIEPNDLISKDKFEVLWRDSEGVRGFIFFESGNKKNHLEFAAQMYDQIARGSEFYLKTSMGYEPILNDMESRKPFHISMIDYYGLLRSL